jgi:hypothetical protein
MSVERTQFPALLQYGTHTHSDSHSRGSTEAWPSLSASADSTARERGTDEVVGVACRRARQDPGVHRAKHGWVDGWMIRPIGRGYGRCLPWVDSAMGFLRSPTSLYFIELYPPIA